MNIKTKLAIQFSLMVVGILLLFSLFVYYFSYTSQLSKFRDSLLEKAKNSAILLIDVAEMDATLLKKIHQSTILLEEEEIVVIDSSLDVIYSNNEQYLLEDLTGLNANTDDISFFTIAEKDGVCFRHRTGNDVYTVFLMAFDSSREEKMSDLRFILLWSVLLCTLLSVLFSYFFAKRAIRPIARIINGVKEINSLRLNRRIDEGNKKDEIAQLAITFNQLLTDLEIAFNNQQDLVSNASHELRTPLTVMIGGSDYILSHERTVEEYKAHITDLVTDLKRLNGMASSLLELAQVSRDRSIQLSDIRIDEIVYDAIFFVKNKYPGRKILPKILYPDNSRDLLVRGNAGLLAIAFENLLDNACKFSPDDVYVEFIISPETLNVVISDSGIGIPPADLDSIFNPFMRASNVRYIGGFGIGLSLVARIIALHDAGISVDSAENKGTTFTIWFNKTNS